MAAACTITSPGKWRPLKGLVGVIGMPLHGTRRRSPISQQNRQATNKEDMRGPFLEVSTAIERLFRLLIWGWAQLVFGVERDSNLRRILNEENPGRRYVLDGRYHRAVSTTTRCD